MHCLSDKYLLPASESSLPTPPRKQEIFVRDGQAVSVPHGHYDMRHLPGDHHVDSDV